MPPLALLGVALVVDVDPAKVLLVVSGSAASFAAWLAQGWWKEREKSDAERQKADAERLKALEGRVAELEEQAAITRTRHDREDGARDRESP